MNLKKIRIGQITFNFNNYREFLYQYKDIFLLREYTFASDKKDPFIIDCGAHIGVPLLYFKKKFPKSSVLCFEPNSRIFAILKKNAEENGLTGVKLINSAVFNKKGFTRYFLNANPAGYSHGNSVISPSFVGKKYAVSKVSTVKLSTFITRPVDLLKIDIEGAEFAVLEEIKNKLALVKNIIMEVHLKTKEDLVRYRNTETLLRKNNFTIVLKKVGRIRSGITGIGKLRPGHRGFYVLKATQID